MTENSSISIILDLYKKSDINLNEAIQLIEDLYKPTYIQTYPIYPQWPQITYTEPYK